MVPITAHLKMLRYYDRLIIRGKRLVVGTDYSDPCTRTGHESLLSWLSLYTNDNSVSEHGYQWGHVSAEHLNHIMQCRHCMGRVFSIPSPGVQELVAPILLRAMV